MSLRNTIFIPRVGTAHDPVLLTGMRGINNATSDDFINDSELSDASNYILDMNNSGVLVKREGVTKEVSTQLTEAVTSIFDGIEGDYFSTSTKIYTFDGTERVSGLTLTTNPDWASFKDRDIYVDGTNAPRVSTNGTTFSLLGGTPPTFKYVEPLNNIVFGAGHNENSLRWSAYNDSGSWPSTNELIFVDVISGLKRFRNNLLVLCENSFYFVNGFSETDIRVVYYSHDEGGTSNRSIIASPYGLYWWTRNGPAWLDDNQVLHYIGKGRIPKTLDGLNRGQYSLIHGIWNPIQERVEWWVFKSTSTTVDRKIIYYPRMQLPGGESSDGFFIGDGLGVEMGASGVIVRSGVAKVYVGSASTTGYFYEQTGSTDDGTPIKAHLDTKRVSPSGVNAHKRLKRLTPLFILEGNSTITLGVYLDGSLSQNKTWDISISATQGFVLGTDTLGVGKLGTGAEPSDTQVAYSTKYHTLKARVSDSAAARTRFRGIVLDGYITSA